MEGKRRRSNGTADVFGPISGPCQAKRGSGNGPGRGWAGGAETSPRLSRPAPTTGPALEPEPAPEPGPSKPGNAPKGANQALVIKANAGPIAGPARSQTQGGYGPPGTGPGSTRLFPDAPKLRPLPRPAPGRLPRAVFSSDDAPRSGRRRRGRGQAQAGAAPAPGPARGRAGPVGPLAQLARALQTAQAGIRPPRFSGQAHGPSSS